MAKQLLTEWLPFQVGKDGILQESTSKQRLIVKGILQRADAPNRNGRVYPKRILEKEVENYIENFVKPKRAFGELDHPDSSIVTLANVSHNILDVKWSGDNVVGTVEVLDTPNGRILETLFRLGYTVGISSRGLGSVTELEEGVLQVEDDFELIAWDFVSNPSTHGAFMAPKDRGLTESVNSNNTYESSVDHILSDIFCTIGGTCKLKSYGNE